MENTFVKNYNKDVSPFLEEKKTRQGNGLSSLKYLRYGDCIRLFKEEYGNNGEVEVMTSTSQTEDGTIEIPYFKCKKANYAYVRTRVIVHNTPIGDMVQEEILPIMDDFNKSIPLDKITTADVDDTIARCKVKNIAIATGIGLCVFCDGKSKDHIEEIQLTEKDEALYKDNLFMFMYKSDPLRLKTKERQTKQILGAKYVNWADFVLALKTLFPYSTFGNKFSYTHKEEEEILNYLPRERGEIATSSWVKVVYPVHEKNNIIYKETIVSGERRVLDTTRLKTVNLNIPGYTRTDKYGNTKQVNIDFGFQINTGNKRCFCKTIAENLGLYLPYYQKEQNEQETNEQEATQNYSTNKTIAKPQNSQTKELHQEPNNQNSQSTVEEVKNEKNVALNGEYEEVIGRNYPLVDEDIINEYNYISKILYSDGKDPWPFEKVATLNKIKPVELTTEIINKQLNSVAKGVLKTKVNYFMEDKKLYSSSKETRSGFNSFDIRIKKIAKEQGIENLTEEYFKENGLNRG